MDEKDGRIIVELATNPFASLESVGRAVHLTGTSVKSRLDRLEARRVFKGIALVPTEHAFDRVACYCLYRNVPDGQALVERVLGSEDVVWCHRSHPDILALMVYLAPDAVAQPPRSLTNIMGREPDLWHVSKPRATPSIELSPLDWRIIHPLVGTPRAAIEDLAAQTGLTVKTVRQRRRRMMDQGVLVPHPLVDSSAEPGHLFFKILVGIDSIAAVNRVRAAVASRARGPRAGLNGPPSIFLWGVAATYPEAHLVEFSTRRVPGVTRTDFAIPLGGAVATERLQGWVADALRRWGRKIPAKAERTTDRRTNAR